MQHLFFDHLPILRHSARAVYSDWRADHCQHKHILDNLNSTKFHSMLLPFTLEHILRLWLLQHFSRRWLPLPKRPHHRQSLPTNHQVLDSFRGSVVDQQRLHLAAHERHFADLRCQKELHLCPDHWRHRPDLHIDLPFKRNERLQWSGLSLALHIRHLPQHLLPPLELHLPQCRKRPYHKILEPLRYSHRGLYLPHLVQNLLQQSQHSVLHLRRQLLLHAKQHLLVCVSRRYLFTAGSNQFFNWRVSERLSAGVLYQRKQLFGLSFWLPELHQRKHLFGFFYCPKHITVCFWQVYDIVGVTNCPRSAFTYRYSLQNMFFSHNSRQLGIKNDPRRKTSENILRRQTDLQRYKRTHVTLQLPYRVNRLQRQRDERRKPESQETCPKRYE